MTSKILICIVAFVIGCSSSSKADRSMTDQQYGEAMAGEHAADDASANGAADQAIGAFATSGASVEYADLGGQPIAGYLATPDKPEIKAAVILIHEWWGLNDNIRAVADRLASHGYLALAVDMYGGTSADSPEKAKELMMAAMQNPERGAENLRAARAFLAAKGAQRVGVIGWCFGGGWSLEAALTQGAEIAAVVMYYGRVKTTPEEVKALASPLLGIFGARDEGIPVEQVRLFEAALTENGADARIHVYDGVGHAFANPSGKNYSREAAEDAWAKTLAFFGAHLGS